MSGRPPSAQATHSKTHGQQATIRWTQFHSALQLAIQRVAHKWTYEDFKDCFPQYCEEQPEGSSGLHTTVARHIESAISKQCDKLMAGDPYFAHENLDRLHGIVVDARERKRRGELDRKDLWRENLEPRAAIRARTIPVLEKEVERLKEILAEKEKRNMELQNQMQANVRARNEADEQTEKLLDRLEEVAAEWGKLPTDEIQQWALKTAETLNTTRPR